MDTYGLDQARIKAKSRGDLFATEPIDDECTTDVDFRFRKATWGSLADIQNLAEKMARYHHDPHYVCHCADPEGLVRVIRLETGETEGFIEIKNGRVRSWFSQVDPKDVQGQASEPPRGLAHLPPNCS